MKFEVKRIPLNGGGYTSRGQYYGVGSPLYRADAMVELGGGKWDEIQLEFRAADRSAAIDYVVAKFPDATFYRGKSK
jgi:hypothetical protein